MGDHRAVEGVQRARHRVIGVVRVRLGLGQQQDAILIDQHGQLVLVHAGEAELPHGVRRQGRTIDLPQPLARIQAQTLDRIRSEQEHFVVSRTQLQPAKRILAAPSADTGKRACFPEQLARFCIASAHTCLPGAGGGRSSFSTTAGRADGGGLIDTISRPLL